MVDMLTAVAIIFVVAGPFLLFANRYNLPAAPLLIVGGIVAGFAIDEAVLLELAQFGIALLVFSFGVTIQLDTIDTVLRDSELAAVVQIIVVGTLGLGFGLVAGFPPAEAAIFGIAAALSSTIIASALLETEVNQDLVHGRLGQSIQFVQDLFAIAVLLVMGAAAFELDPIVLQIGYGVLFLAGAVFVNRFVFDQMGRLAGDSTELMLIGIVSLLVVFIGAAAAVDLPIVLGAFAAGIAVRYAPGEYLGLYNGLDALKDFFIAIFFSTVGALVVLPFIQLDPMDSLVTIGLVSGLVVLTVVIKPLVTMWSLVHRGYETRTAVLTGLSTDQVSEFALIIAIQALLIGLLSQPVFDVIILAAAVTMITSSLTWRNSERICQTLSAQGFLPSRHERIDRLSLVPEALEQHVIILGYGQTGRAITKAVDDLGHAYLVVENDPSLSEDIRFECDAYVLGDAMEGYTWEKAKAAEATVVISTVESAVVSQHLLELDIDAGLILRAPDEPTAIGFLDAGAMFVVVPDLLASEQLTKYIGAVLDGDWTAEELRAAGLDELEFDPSTRSRLNREQTGSYLDGPAG